MATEKLLNQVINKFNSLLFLSPEEKEQRLALIYRATPEGLLELLDVFKEAYLKQKKYLRILCESDPKFAKDFYKLLKKGEAETRAGKKLRGLKKKINKT